MAGKKSGDDIKKYMLHIGMSEKSINDMSLKPGDHEFFVKVHDDWEKSIKGDFKNMLSDFLEKTEAHISNTYDHHAKIICDVVREMLVEQSVSTEKMVRNIVAEQNKDIFKKIDDQNKTIRKIQDLLADIQETTKEHTKLIEKHDLRIGRLENKLRELLSQHNHVHALKEKAIEFNVEEPR